MNKDTILKRTSNYQDELIKDLQDTEEAKAYLEAAFEAYDEDGHTDVLLLAMRNVAQAQGGIGELAKRTSITREHLYDVLASKHNPRLDNWLDILAGLGFRVRLEQLNQQETQSHSI